MSALRRQLLHTAAGFAALLTLGMLPAEDAPEVSEADARARCLVGVAPEREGFDCSVQDFGEAAEVDGKSFVYAQYAYQPKGPGGQSTWLVVFERTSEGRLKPVIRPEADGAFFYSQPRLVRAHGKTLLQLPAYESGTGDFNREAVFAWRDGAWKPADVTSWLEDLAHRLPKGLSALKGVYPDYAKLTAETPLWRKADGDACASAGRAKLALGWRDDRLELKSIKRVKAGECGEPLGH